MQISRVCYSQLVSFVLHLETLFFIALSNGVAVIEGRGWACSRDSVLLAHRLQVVTLNVLMVTGEV